MIRIIINRIGQGIITLFVLVTLTFFLVRAMPGSPYTGEKAIPAHALKRMKEYTGLDKPVTVQYITYLKNLVFHQDLGDLTGTRCPIHWDRIDYRYSCRCDCCS